jgi:HSP20 family protein
VILPCYDLHQKQQLAEDRLAFGGTCMAITRWETYRDVLALQNRMNSLFQDFSRTNSGENELATAGFVPPVDIFEDENKLVLTIEIPGMRQEDLDVRLENNTLSVKGERSFQSEGKEENFHRVERRYGSFYRAFTIPNTVDPNSIKADYEAGVLHLELHKRAETKPKQIKVNVGSGKQQNQNQPATVATATTA